MNNSRRAAPGSPDQSGNIVHCKKETTCVHGLPWSMSTTVNASSVMPDEEVCDRDFVGVTPVAKLSRERWTEGGSRRGGTQPG